MTGELSDAKISRWVRPAILIWFTIWMSVLMIVDGNLFGITIDDSWIELLKMVSSIVFGSYFLGKSYEHASRMVAQIKKEKNDEGN